jgi:hypothetical protein
MGTLTSIYEEIQEEYKGRWNQWTKLKNLS